MQILVCSKAVSLHCCEKQPISARYLKGTQSHVLLVRPMSVELVGYADSNWGNDVVDRKSTTGALLQLGGCVIVWKTRKQNMVALSTSKAEFVAASDAVKKFSGYVIYSKNSALVKLNQQYFTKITKELLFGPRVGPGMLSTLLFGVIS